jgi:hypothetical protein
MKKLNRFVEDWMTGRLGRRRPRPAFVARARRTYTPRPASAEDQRMWERVFQMQRELHVPRMSERHVWFDHEGHRFRAIGSDVYYSPQGSETFHEFLVNQLLLQLGRPWFEEEGKKPLEDRHIVLRWRAELIMGVNSAASAPNTTVSILPTGNMKSLLVLADDVWQLRQAGTIPEWLLGRLRNHNEFQGARYEVAVAALFARAGYVVDFVPDSSTRHPEFVAAHRTSGERVAVEAKSPRRPGVLHEEPTDVSLSVEVPKKVGRLFRDALGQIENSDCPAFVFVDLNLPLTPGVQTERKPWFAPVIGTTHHIAGQVGLPPPLVGLVVTNFGWHYYRDHEGGDGEFAVFRLPSPAYTASERIWSSVGVALREVGFLPDPERHEHKVRMKYPEFNEQYVRREAKRSL